MSPSPPSRRKPEQHDRDVKWDGWYQLKHHVVLECQPPFSRLLVNGTKSMEIRRYTLPTPLLKTAIPIIEPINNNDIAEANISSSLPDVLDGGIDVLKSKIKVVGWAKFDRVMTIRSRMAFNFSKDKHLVEPDSPYGWDDEKDTILYGWIVDECGEFDENDEEGTTTTTTTASAAVQPPATTTTPGAASGEEEAEAVVVTKIPIIDHMERRLRSLFEFHGGPTGDDHENDEFNVAPKPRLTETDHTNRPLQYINDIVMISDVVEVRSEKAAAKIKRMSKKKMRHEGDGGEGGGDEEARPSCNEAFDSPSTPGRGPGGIRKNAAEIEREENAATLSEYRRTINLLEDRNTVLTTKVEKLENELIQLRVRYDEDKSDWETERMEWMSKVEKAERTLNEKT